MPRHGSASQRGYGRAHERERQRWVARVDAGLVTCARCREPIEPGRPWDLGHNDERTAWTGPEHTVCNRRAGANHGAMVAAALRAKTAVRTSQAW
jgi:hypothetical protein